MLKYAAAFAFVLALTAPGGADQSKPTVYVNHTLVTPDAATYAAIRANAFLRDQFGAMEERTTVRTDETYHGMYFYGTHTYFELTQTRKGWPVGLTGIGFSVDNAGELSALQSRFANTFSKRGTIEHVTRMAETGKQVPWFTDLEMPYNPAERLEFFVMAYDPQFLAQWYPQFPPSEPATTRSAVLDRYVAKIGKEQARATGLMDDVDSIGMTGPVLTNVCDALDAASTGASCVVSGVTLTFSGRGESRVCAVRFRLKRDAQSQTLDLGSSSLTLAGREAKWTFCKSGASFAAKHTRR